MRYKPGHKEETRQRILDAAGHSFRKNGFNGIGVDGLAKAAGVTSGAFYTHFTSKKSVFVASLISSMEDLQASINTIRLESGDQWWQVFAESYLNKARTRSEEGSCPLPSLSSEVGRSDDEIRELFEVELVKIVSAAKRSPVDGGRDNTWSNLAMLVGGVTLARAVKDDELSDEIVKAVRAGLVGE